MLRQKAGTDGSEEASISGVQRYLFARNTDGLKRSYDQFWHRRVSDVPRALQLKRSHDFSCSHKFALNVQFVPKQVKIWLSNARSAVNSASPTSASTSLPHLPNLTCDSLHSFPASRLIFVIPGLVFIPPAGMRFMGDCQF